MSLNYLSSKSATIEPSLYIFLWIIYTWRYRVISLRRILLYFPLYLCLMAKFMESVQYFIYGFPTLIYKSITHAKLDWRFKIINCVYHSYKMPWILFTSFYSVNHVSTKQNLNKKINYMFWPIVIKSIGNNTFIYTIL